MSWGQIQLRNRINHKVLFTGEASPAPGGGSMAVDVFSVPVAFNTPGLARTPLPISAADDEANTFTVTGDYAYSFGVGDTVIVGDGLTFNDAHTVASVTLVGGNTVVEVDPSEFSMAGATDVIPAGSRRVGGVLLGSVEVGDVVAGLGWPVSEAWNGPTPTGRVFVDGTDPSVAPQADLSTADDALAAGGMSAPPAGFGSTSAFVVTASGDLYAEVSDGSGGDPVSSQGAGVIVGLIGRPS